MRKATKFAAALGAGVMALAPALAAQASQVSVHDPVMAKEGSTYYLYSTGPGITFYSSIDMVHWKPEGRVFAGEPAWAKRAAPTFNDHIWAPDVHRHNGRWLLYYSVSGFGKNTSGIGVTTNATLHPRAPNYRWEDQGMVVQSVPGRDMWNAIDPNVVEDDKGQGWMTFGSFWGGIKLVKLDDSWTKIAEPQEWHTIARRERPAFTPDEQAAPAEIEGPFIFKKNGYYYLFVSWGLCCQGPKSTYHVVVGRARDVMGPYLDRQGKDMAQGGGSLVIQGDKDWKALGHNSAYTFDGKDYLVLHAYETADRYKQKLKVMDIRWDKDGWPTVDPKDLNRYVSEEVK
ncbi:arabinan endo-1,5-alpha-L-arabinosidase [Massilia putida]|uniref:arabinan endo-1,5-alpha-L-arabinosidase n=1 Tax=Massilia putida TaxID=1141883 RepID=UPI00095152C7|nr:arabinan endo-1,5-alpha-L-arabinosidase [Massilia putida]